jgi:iron complex outermembrane receptor protein
VRIEATSPAAQVRDGRHDFAIFNAFAQDDFKVIPDRLTLTAGVKLEHNSFTKLEVQPSVRAVFKPAEQQTLWGAISRAVRTPSVLEGRDVFAIVMGAPEPGPDGGLYLPTLFADGRADSEVLWAYELGYRVQPTKRFSVELNVYLHDYARIIAPGDAARFIPGVPLGTKELLWGNYVDGTARGAEAALIVSPSDAWRLTLAYTTMVFDARGSPAALSNLVTEPPRHQVSLRSAYDFTRRASFDAGLRYVDRNAGTPAYVSADARLSYRPNERLELALVGKNLLEPQHPEQPPIAITTASEVPRSIHGKITWRF